MKTSLATLISLMLLIISACQEVDLCEGVTCFNDGYCQDGTCICPEGYAQPACGFELTPEYVRVEKLRLLSYPTEKLNGSSGFDSDDLPDIFIQFLLNESQPNLLQHTTDIKWDADTSIVHEYMPDVNFPPGNYRIRLVDADTSSLDDPMVDFLVDFYKEGQGFPKELLVEGVYYTTSSQTDTIGEIEVLLSYHF